MTDQIAAENVPTRAELTNEEIDVLDQLARLAVEAFLECKGQ